MRSVFSATTVALVGMALAVPTAASAAGSASRPTRSTPTPPASSGSPRTATTSTRAARAPRWRSSPPRPRCASCAGWASSPAQAQQPGPERAAVQRPDRGRRRLLRRLPAVLEQELHRGTCYVGRNDDGTRRQTLYEEMTALAAKYPKIIKPVEIGRSRNGLPILALKFTKDARKVSDGRRPAVLYSSNQHAREWITPEMNRRLAHMFAELLQDRGRRSRRGRGRRPAAPGDLTKGDVTRILNENELWIVISANPDGYDFTFTPEPPVAQEPARAERPAGHPGRRRRGPEPQLPDRVEVRQRGLGERSGRRHLPRPQPGLRARDAGDGRPAAEAPAPDADQLPLGRAAAAVSVRLPGRDLHGGRPDLPRPLGHGRGLRGQGPGRGAQRLRP